MATSGAEADAVWADYCEAGLTITEIACRRKLSFGKVQSLLKKHPEYAAIAAERQRDAPAASRQAAMKAIDTEEALRLLSQGLGTRAVAARYGVCTRTLRKRLLAFEQYDQIMAARGIVTPEKG